MEQFDFITKLLGIKDSNIIFDKEILDMGTHKELKAILDYLAPPCPHCQGQVDKYDFQRESKLPFLDCAGYRILIRLKKRRFKCKDCGKISVAETSLTPKNHQIPTIVKQKVAQLLIEKASMTAIADRLSSSTSTVIRKLNEFTFKTNLNSLPEMMSWDEYAFKKGKMSFIVQDFNTNNIIAILNGRTQAVIQNRFLRYPRQVRNRVKIITMDMFSPYYDLAKKLFPYAKIVLDRFHIAQHLGRAMNRVRTQIMNAFDRKSHEYKTLKRYWKLIQHDSQKLSDKCFYRPTFRMHLTNKEVVEHLLGCSDELRKHYDLYQLLLFHFQEKQADHFFDLIEEQIDGVKPFFQTVFRTFMKDRDKIEKTLVLSYSNAKLEATNNIIKVIKRNAFGFWNFENFKKRILIAISIKKEKTKPVLSRC
ncbi:MULTISPECIES: ISL3 family transposase [unclassified Streptococcus]|uniref:ISL3 family transposase n=1 Tax=unclassified Streptococcus TaxID=2608887 RepID=UPI001072753E|nr:MULTISPECIES: ISL3 family transposase [unclassified Streptococcus]MBF0787081.1 ISL3 family transposase [Streptococcus sp. 19428wC2_LYSM12]MCQ9211361.1 ISL3 family transposase [Streptococcus sp. B01]MCQ9214673.1 ISL3 family transposase [Streptococcus sp. O1]TFV05969.1 ISL3 family transposase [Streptococcus sp. LYSM12]